MDDLTGKLIYRQVGGSRKLSSESFHVGCSRLVSVDPINKHM